MVRFLPLGNGRLLVTFDRDMNLIDFYYSKSQSENHGGHPFKMGIMVDKNFNWVRNDNIIDYDYMDHTAIGRIYSRFDDVAVTIYNFVYPYMDIFVRRVELKNLASNQKNIKLFFHQNFNIYGNNIGDTAIYEPVKNVVIHYKGRRYFLASTIDESGKTMDTFAIGVKDFGGLEGTWKDAEDGVLSKNPVAIGSVDSVIGHTIILPPGGEGQVYYYISCGNSEENVVNKIFDFNELKYFELRTANFWRTWSNKGNFPMETGAISLFKRSLFIIRSHMNQLGAISASSDSDILKSNKDGYYYVWPRDAAIAAFALMKSTHYGPARLFFQFSMDVVEDDGYFFHKYNMNGTRASSWIPRIMKGRNNLPIQEDETALVIWSLYNYHNYVRDIEFISNLYENLIKKSSEFLYNFQEGGLPKPSFDLWEERYGIHAFTVATVYGALNSASKFADLLGETSYAEKYKERANEFKQNFIEMFYSKEKGQFARSIIDGNLDLTIDASLLLLPRFGIISPDDPKMRNTFEKIISKLWVPNIGGLARYEGDNYQRIKPDPQVPGNPWIITTLWAADYYHSIGEKDKALELINWVINHSQSSGVLSEQINPYNGEPLSVSPLVWSHSEYVITLLNRINR